MYSKSGESRDRKRIRLRPACNTIIEDGLLSLRAIHYFNRFIGR